MKVCRIFSYFRPLTPAFVTVRYYLLVVAQTKLDPISFQIQELLSEPARDTECSDNIKPGTLLRCHKAHGFLFWLCLHGQKSCLSSRTFVCSISCFAFYLLFYGGRMMMRITVYRDLVQTRHVRVLTHIYEEIMLVFIQASFMLYTRCFL